MADTQIDAPAEAAKPKKEDSFLVFLIKLVIFVAIFRSFIMAPFSIPSESMLPRLWSGDYLIVSKWPYGYSKHSLPFSIPLIPGRIFSSLPARGDVVVFKAPPSNNVDFIKRVIGLPGDTIQMQSGQLFLNGKPVPKQRVTDLVIPVSANAPCESSEFQESASDGSQRCRYPRYKETLPGGRSYYVLDLGDKDADNTDVYTVPAGSLFMMGDNRDNSEDSRFPAMEGKGIGYVPIENLVGRAWFTVFSTDGSSNWFLPWTWFTAARGDRIGEGF